MPILYEWSSPDARNNTFVDHEMENPEMEAWTEALVHAPDLA